MKSLSKKFYSVSEALNGFSNTGYFLYSISDISLINSNQLINSDQQYELLFERIQSFYFNHRQDADNCKPIVVTKKTPKTFPINLNQALHTRLNIFLIKHSHKLN